MKINKDFAVKVEGKIFKTDEMTKISIEGWRVNIVCSYSSGTVVTVNARVNECEFLEVPQITKRANCIPEMPELPKPKPKCTNCRVEVAPLKKYKPAIGDEPTSDIEVVPPLGTLRLEEAFDKIDTAAKGFNETFIALRNSIETLGRVTAETLKKHNPTGGD